MPAQMLPKEDLILDSTVLFRQYVKPEQDLLDFDNDDMDIITEQFANATTKLNALEGLVNPK